MSFIGYAIITNFSSDICLIRNISSLDCIKNQKKVIKIFWSTIWLLNITSLFWQFLIKWNENIINTEKPRDKYIRTVFNLKLFNICTILECILIIILVVFLSEFTYIWKYWLIAVISLIIFIMIIIDIKNNVKLIKKLSSYSSIKNQKKVIKIFWSTIWLLNITSLFWQFLIKWDDESNETEINLNWEHKYSSVI